MPPEVLKILQGDTVPGLPSMSEESTEKATVSSILRDQMIWIQNSVQFSDEQKKAAAMMAICKTPALGTYVEYCPECEKVVDVHYCSCNNRNCPQCQFPLQQKWIELRKNEVVPNTPYFHIILTVPHELNQLIMQNSKAILGILFRTSAAAVVEMCEDPKYLGAKPGIVSVLHTWTQDLQMHYHIHMICTAGGLDENGWYKSLKKLYKDSQNSLSDPQMSSASSRKVQDTWQAEDADVMGEVSPDTLTPERSAEKDDNLFFLPLKALMNLFRGKFMHELSTLYDAHALKLGDTDSYLDSPYEWSTFCHGLYQKEWIGYIARTFEGHGNAIEYLARYTFRTAISNSRIIAYDGKNVSFTVRNNQTPGQKDIVTLEVHKFIRRLLSHVLPKGFTRVRFYGFLSNGHKRKHLDEILQQLCNKDFSPSPLKDAKGVELLNMLFLNKNIGRCPCCGCELKVFQNRDLELRRSSARAAPAA